MSMIHRPLRIALFNVVNHKKGTGVHKELNAGFGTVDNFGGSFLSNIIKIIRRNSVRVPIVGFAYLQSIFKCKGYDVRYFEGHMPTESVDLVLIYGSLVDYKEENRMCAQLKRKFLEAKVGFWGPFPSRFPDLFQGDFVLLGEAEAFFLNDFESIDQLSGHVSVSTFTDMDALPTPCYDGFPLDTYGYYPALTQAPFATLLASKGCPYGCKFYCTYGEYQGAEIRQRSPEKIVDDIIYLQEQYGIRSIQFRDPVFGLAKEFIPTFCEGLAKKGVVIEWGIETRLDLLDENLIRQMQEVGLRHINVGIETKDSSIAKQNKRNLIQESHQERLIVFCNNVGISISAFYMLGLEGDTIESIRNTISYAIKLNTPLARFAVSTPYPGTGFYEKLEREGRILTKDFEAYTQFDLVFQHETLTPKQMKSLVNEALRRFYFRPSYFILAIRRFLLNSGIIRHCLRTIFLINFVKNLFPAFKSKAAGSHTGAAWIPETVEMPNQEVMASSQTDSGKIQQTQVP